MTLSGMLATAYPVLPRLSKIGRPHRFKFYAQPISNTVDIVEVRRHLVRINDAAVVYTNRAEAIDVVPRHVPRLQCELDRVATEGSGPVVELMETSLGDRRGERGIV